MTPTEADIMDIITQNEATKQHFVRKSLSAIISSVLLIGSSYANAKLDISGSANVSTVFQDIDSEQQGNFSSNTLSIKPSINATYQSRSFRGVWQGKLTHLERDNDDIIREDTYGEYSYSADWAPFERLLSFQASGALSYQNAQAGNFLVSDFFTNADALAKTRSNRFGMNSSFSQGNWLRGSGQAYYSDVASEQNSVGNGQALNNNSYQVSGSLLNGDRAKSLFWNLTGSFQNTAQDQENQGDFISRNASGFADIHLLDRWALRVTGTHEGNQVSGRIDTNSLVRKFSTYGAGITYRQNEARFISITVNTTESDIERDDGETFVGLDMRWALSARTSISANYGRRFFGETAGANLSYNSKHLRTAFSYSEDVTNTSRLLANPENLGVFVCPVNSGSIASCFQPNSLNYTPNADEQFVQFTTQNLEFNDDIIVRKSGNFQIGYDFSRVTLGMSWRYSEDDALDQDRLTRTYSYGTTIAYKVGGYSELNANINYANIEQRSQTLTSGESENWNMSIGFSRNVGRSLTASADVSYIDRSGDLINTNGVGSGLLGSDFTDRRITLSFVYAFD